MPYSKKLKLAFIHIPKCGGTTINNILKNYLLDDWTIIPPNEGYDHQTINELIDILVNEGENPAMYEYFAVIREPEDRIYSFFNMGKKFNYIPMKDMNFLEYCQYLHLQSKVPDKNYNSFQLRKLVDYLGYGFDNTNNLINVPVRNIFLLSQFNKTLEFIEKHIQHKFSPLEIVVENVGKYVNNETEEQLDMGKKIISEIFDSDKKIIQEIILYQKNKY